MERKNKEFWERLKKRMVHRKYIKRGDKVFGPYLYENYREKGVIKTRYLGKDDSKKRKNLRVNKTFFIILGIIFIVMISILILFLLEKNLFFRTGENLKGELFTTKFLDILNLLLGIKETLKGELPSEKNVNVFVNVVGNLPPEIGNVQDEILVCENKPLSYFFNVSDADGIDEVTVGISDIEPFFVRLKRRIDDFRGEYEIFSWGNLIKKDINEKRIDAQGWATYLETITANDGEEVDSAEINITIIEINNPPKFNIGTKTIDLYTKGDNNVFYYDLGAYLRANFEETPTENLTFNLTFLNGTSFFNISNRGIVNVTGNESFILPGQNSTTYWVNISVYDKGLLTIVHSNISLCFPDDNESRHWSDDFRITVTKENRAPVITSYYPLNLSLNITGTDNLYFNISSRDPDWNPVDVYWYVDDVQKEYFEALYENNLSKFEYIFGCGIFGNHTVKSVVTDGLLNASVQWNLSVEYVECPKPQPPGGGGGGGGGRLYCEEKWGCNDWMQCQNLNELVKEGWVSKETELLIKERCKIFNYSGELCGFQTRICTDFNYCNLSFNKPGIIRECYFTENPNCTDGIKNCHDGACEVLVDCGGSCLPCPTCSDKIQNQGEEGVDCGGPCEPCKELPFRPILFKSIVSYSLIALLILILILVTKELREYYLSKKRAEEKSIKNIIKQEKRQVYRILFIIFVVLLLFFANVYITKFTQEDIISGVSKIGEGFLASYNFINGFIKSLGIFFISGVLENENSKLQIWDDTDNLDRFTICSQYCIQKEKPSSNLWTVYFYANYTNKTTGEPLSGGACEIRFEDENHNYGAWEGMTYNSLSKFFEYSKQFSYKGDYNFEVNCSYNLYSIIGEEGFEITNTAPYIIKTAAGYIDLDADGEKEVWQCFEDSACYYNFSANVSEDDMNDELVFGYLLTGNTTLTDFKINSSSGILEINITHSSYTGNGKKVELSVSDTERTASAILEVNVQDVNDAPIFVNLTDKTFNALDLFEYIVYVTDEENNFPFKFNISFVSCNAPGRSNCTLFDYSVDEMQGKINISFTPTLNDTGNYLINFSVMDNSSLGNKTTSQLVNFSVNRALWKTPLALGHILTENQEFYLNLSENVTSENITFSFAKKDYFPSFNLISNGIINFTPADQDVGYHEVEIIASDLQTSSPKTFNFSVLNINDNVSIRPLQVSGATITLLNITAFENANVKIYLFVEDDDFLIPLPQKSFYDESLTMNLTIEGTNTTLFNFVFDSINGNEARYIAGFIPRDSDVGSYNITINVTDKSNSSDVLKFNLTIIDRNYDTPVINYPDANYEFNLKENVSFNLTFRANHTLGDNLTYKFYINDELRNSLNYYGDNKNLTWQFTPNFTDETYNETKNLKLLVLNPFFPEINTSRTWNLTINHTNYPVMFIKEITDKGPVSYPYEFGIDLMDYFYDADYYDSHYNSTPEGILNFTVNTNSSDSKIYTKVTSDNWVYIGSFAATIEELNIYAKDNESFVISNNFTVIFVPPEIVQVPTPTPSGGGGGGSEKIISLKIIIPGKLSAYEHEKIDVPLSLINAGKTIFNDLTLTSSAFKDGNLSKEVNTSLDKNYFKSLNPGQKEDLNLTVFFDTDKVGDYEILVNVTSRSPVYTDWGKIHINLQKINESQVRELIIFTQEFIVKNPQCIEIQEIVKEAEKLFEQGDYVNARIKSEQAIEACKESISQPSVPKKKSSPFEISLYLIIATLLAFAIGIAYYFFKRRKIQKMKNLQEVKLRAMRETKPLTDKL